MNLADERLKELDNPSLTENERILIRCRVAADLTHKGQYEAACEALGGLWLGVGQRPPVRNLPPAVDAEVLLRCGTLTRLLGNVRNVAGAQEQAKDILSEAQRLFRAQGMPAKASEAQYELAMCYWWPGQHDEARVVLREALKPLTDADLELKAKILIRRTIVEVWDNRCYDALNILREAEPVFESANDALKGRWHGQKGLVLRRLGTAEGQPDYFDRAIIEYTAAIYHYEQARHERLCGNNLNNVAFLLYKLGRYGEAHEHLDRAQLIFTKLKDAGSLAQVDETRARVLVAEKKYRDAERIIVDVIKTFEQGGEAALLADALTVQGVVWARVGAREASINILREAINVAQESGALTQAGQAALTLIEEHGATWQLSESDLVKMYHRAANLLKGMQDAEDKERLLACAQIVIRRLSGMQLHNKNFSFYGAVHELEARLIEQALELEEGNVARAAERLGLKRQTLSHMLQYRHKKLVVKRTPPTPRLKSIIKDPPKE
ncbi:MAG TPA: helix-turn-helix domain-containing protein [Pyrinomonadaceae bacterium]|nr:helix-turn-helix domain-containing protein [Pyrinomonadaceae bacterium]